MFNKRIFSVILSIAAIIIFVLTFLKTPESITETLNTVTSDNQSLAVIVHAVFLILLAAGVMLKKFRSAFFGILLLILSGTAAVIAIKNSIIPNVIIFKIFFILTLRALMGKELTFQLSEQALMGKVIGAMAIVVGFYYLHWVEEPILLNALLYSPLGIVNCPTIAAFGGLLCFLKRPGSPQLEAFVGIMNLYFGFFGLMRLGVYVDIVMIIAGSFLLVRLASELDKSTFHAKGFV